MKTLIKLVKVGFTTLFIVLLPVVAFTIITSKTDVLFGIRSYVVLTGSMSPVIPTGSIAFMKPSDSYNVDDVIAFHRGNIVVTHRIVQVVSKDGGTYYKVKGDANKSADGELVAQKDIVGKGLFQAIYVGRIVMFARTVQGFLLLIGVPAVIFIGMELWTIKKEIEKEAEKKFIHRMKAKGLWQSGT